MPFCPWKDASLACTDCDGIRISPDSLKGASRQPLAEFFLDKLADNFTRTNDSIEGKGISIVTGVWGAGHVAAQTGGVTFLQGINLLIREYVFTPAAFRAEAAFSVSPYVLRSAVTNFALMTGWFQFGNLVGSSAVALRETISEARNR